MLEYASIRFRFICATPTTVPSTMVTAASPQNTGYQVACSGWNAVAITRTKAANAAAFTPVDMKPDTMVGAPSYASGVHMWNGTADTLNPKPTSSRPSATSASTGCPPACAATTWLTPSSLV